MNNWEDLCKRCGQCCFEKWVEDDGTIRPTNIPCRFLDIVTRECKVYHKRFEVGEGCLKLTPEVVEVVQWLPADCAYVEQIRDTTRMVDDEEPSNVTRRYGRKDK